MRKVFTILTIINTIFAGAKERVEFLPFGDMEQWAVRYIKESALIGGNTKELYVLGPRDTISCAAGNVPYRYKGKTSWGISNAYAFVAGVAKAACTTYPERRGNGWCARLEAKLEKVKVFGLINIEVAIAGTLFLGQVIEPVNSVSEPYKCIDIGVPFTKRPKALMLDLKAKVKEERTLTKALGLGAKTIEGHDEPEVYIYLQKRWEKDGQIYATRVATARERIAKSIPDWKNDHRLELQYGDIRSRKDFVKYKGLFPDGGVFKAQNSRGEMVEIQEVGWASPTETPTHMILMLTAGCYPAFYAAIGNALWVDNVRLVYDE